MAKKHIDLLDSINAIITSLEGFLSAYPLTEGRDFVDGLTRIYFCLGTKRIKMSIDAEGSKPLLDRPLLEWNAKNRVEGFHLLPKFVERAINDEGKFLNQEEISATANKLQLLINK